MHNVKIIDNSGNLIGERFDITSDEVRRYLSKGFHVIDINTHTEITEDILLSMVGVSECVIA